MEKNRYSLSQGMQFVVPSLIGLIAFIMPIPQAGSFNTMLGMLIDLLKGGFKGWLPLGAMVFVGASALFTLFAVLVKPKFVTGSPFLGELFLVSPFWLVSRLLGGVLYGIIYFKLGPEIIWNMDNGGTPGMVLAPALLVIFLVLAGFIPLLTDFGLMEYVGTFARPVMRPLFKLPGRAAVDCLASWVGSSSVAVVITTKVHDQGYYSDREAGVIATCFSVISIAYIYAMADFVGLSNRYFQILISVYLVTLALAFIMPRIWPLASMPDTYSGRAGKQRIDGVPPGKSLGVWAFELAVNRAAGQSFARYVRNIVKTLLSLVVSTMPLVISWGTVALIIANSTPVFRVMGAPFSWLLGLMRIPEAAQVGPAFILSYADQFLAAVVGSGLKTDGARFMCAGISATGLIYMTEVGVLILNSKIPLGFLKLTIIYLIRAVLTVFLLSPLVWVFCGM